MTVLRVSKRYVRCVPVCSSLVHADSVDVVFGKGWGLYGLWLSICVIAYVYALSRSTTFACKSTHQLPRRPAHHSALCFRVPSRHDCKALTPQMPSLPPRLLASTQSSAPSASSMPSCAASPRPLSPSSQTSGADRRRTVSSSHASVSAMRCALGQRMWIRSWLGS